MDAMFEPLRDRHRRLHRLELRYGTKWKAKLRNASPSPLRPRVRFFRGVPSGIDTNDEAVELLLSGPVAWLAFHARTSPLVPAWPRRSGLVRIDVGHYVENEQLTKLLGPGLSSLRSLALPWQGEDTLRLLESSDWTQQLERLRLFGASETVSPAQLDRLLKVALPKLRELELTQLGLGQAGAERLASMPWRPERLTLDFVNLGIKGTVALAGSAALSSVKELSLARNIIGPQGAAAIATSPHLKQLIALELSSTGTGSKTLPPFFEALALKSLKALDLSSCGLKGAGLEPLGKAKNKALSQLTHLDLSGNLMGDDGLTHLSKSTVLSNVRVLRLGGNAIKGKGMVALGKSALLGKVEELTLGHNKFQNTGAKASPPRRRSVRSGG